LYQFVWDRSSKLGEAVLSGDAVAVEVSQVGSPLDGTSVVSYAASGDRPRPIEFQDSSGIVVAVVSATSYRDVSLLLDAGFELEGELPLDGSRAKLRLVPS
jgi:hypothetical protein